MGAHEDHSRDFLLARLSPEVNITNDDNNATAVLTAKAVTMVVLCAVSICVGLIPIQISRCLKWSSPDAITNPKSLKIVGMLLAFGGGVLFSTTFLHMLPEVEESVQALVQDGSLPTVNFPLAQIFVCTGFFIMYLVEEMVHSKLRSHEKKCEKQIDNRSTNDLVENGQISYAANGHSHGYGHGHSHLPTAVLDDKSNFVLTSLRGLLIVLGLSVHELFEGLAIGLESSANYVWYMFAAVAVHKFVIAFCIGVELVASKTNRWLSIAYVCTFAVVSPLGIGVGMLLTGGEGTVTGGPLPVILQGIATGTLLYVVFFEILQHHRDGIHQYLSILCGFVVMFGLQIAKKRRRTSQEAVDKLTSKWTGHQEEMETPESLIPNNQSAQSTLLLAKIGAMFILGLGSLGLGMLPLAVGYCRFKRRQKCALSITPSTNTSSVDASAQGLLTSLLLCFGGGVLLFTTFLHLAPEVRQSVERHQLNGQLYTIGTLSMAELLFCIGFFLVYLVEETVHATLTSKSESSEDLLYRTVSVRRCNKQLPTPVSITTVTTASKSSSWESGNYIQENGERRDINGLSEVTIGPKNCKNEILPVVFVQPSAMMDSMTDAGREEDRFVAPQNIPSTTGAKVHHHHTDTSARGLLTVVALSFHAIFEGLAVGLEPAVASVVYLAAAIATHKLVIAFCVGMELYVAGATRKTILGYLSVLSIVTPLGIIIGLALGYFKNDSDSLGPIPTILQGMATGTLLYVVFFEVLARERANDKCGLFQLAAIITGFMFMLGLQLLTSHAHSHSHSHEHSHGHSHGHSHEGEEGAESEHHHHDHGDGEHVHAITDTIERLSSTVAEAVTQAIMTSTTKS